jgi:diacylglycerol kinase family enzyme
MTTSPARRPAGRLEAVTALALLTALVLALGWLVAYSRGAVLGVVLVSAIGAAVAAALGWWAFTTRRAWKRALNVVLVSCAVAAVALGVAGFTAQYAAQVFGVAVLALTYVAATRRAGAAPPVAGERVTPPAHPWLLVNPRSGDGAAARSGLVEAARDRGVDVRLLAPGEDAGRLARDAVAAGADAVGIAGGDGSLAVIARAAIDLDVPFVCVPAGTRNHFARDLGLDRGEPVDALDGFAGTERRVDVGVVGDRLFLNNVSLGAYASLVHESDYRADKLGTAHAVLPAAFRPDARPVEMSFADGDGHVHDGALVLLIANNPYDLRALGTFGARHRLDSGTLQVSSVRATTGAELAEVLIGVGTGTRRAVAAWAQWTSAVFTVEAPADNLPAAIDGEPVVLPSPVEFGILPRALRVRVPASLAARPARAVDAFRARTVRSLWNAASGREGG